MITGITSGAPRSATATPAGSDLRHAAEAFEAIFLRQMLAAMRQAKLTDGAFASDATDQFVAMQDEQLADTMAAHGRFGIAEMLTRHLSPRVSPS